MAESIHVTAGSFHLQVPADVHCLVQLLAKLGILPGPMKAARVVGDRIDIWFVPTQGTSNIRRAMAYLAEGRAKTSDDSRRRIYQTLQIQLADDQWQEIADADYEAAGLEPPWKYNGTSWIGVQWDRIGNGAWREDAPASCYQRFEFYPMLSGDRDRAIGEAQRLINELVDK